MQRGFTMIELMITIGIVGILVAAAAPGYQDFIVNSRMNAQSSEFVTALHFARSEAIKRNARISVCKSANGTSCATSGTWAQGWIVFVDGGTAGYVDVGDTLLRVHDALTGGSTMTGTSAVASYIAYLSNGMTAQTGQFDLCGPRQSVPGRDIQVATGTGKPRVLTDTLLLSCS